MLGHIEGFLGGAKAAGKDPCGVELHFTLLSFNIFLVHDAVKSYLKKMTFCFAVKHVKCQER